MGFAHGYQDLSITWFLPAGRYLANPGETREKQTLPINHQLSTINNQLK
jgi:hypothetical protein